MITIHHAKLSAPARTARLVCAEYGAEVELVEERPWERREAFATLNPALTLPVIEADGVTAAGIHPVIEYLDETRGTMMRERRLHAGNPAVRAETRRLVDWFAVKLDEEVTRHVVRERVDKRLMPADAGGGSPDAGALRIARANARHHLKYLDYLAGTRSWVAGDAITYADCAAAAAMSVLDYLGEIEWAETPHARDWYARMKSRPAHRALLAERVGSVPPAPHYAELDF